MVQVEMWWTDREALHSEQRMSFVHDLDGDVPCSVSATPPDSQITVTVRVTPLVAKESGRDRT